MECQGKHAMIHLKQGGLFTPTRVRHPGVAFQHETAGLEFALESIVFVLMGTRNGSSYTHIYAYSLRVNHG